MEKARLLQITLCLMHVFFYIQGIEIASVHDVIKNNSNIQYLKCHDSISFEYEPFPLAGNSIKYPNKGTLGESFIITIPNGQVCAWHNGAESTFVYVLDEQNAVKELLSQYVPLAYDYSIVNQLFRQRAKAKHISGRVAVLAHLHADVYGHWLKQVVGRLALLEMQNIEYDWLYVQYDKPFQKEILTLLGVDPQKIIVPLGETSYIQADELIVPSLTDYRIPTEYEKQSPNHSTSSIYCLGWNVDFLRNKFLPLADTIDLSRFSKKVFISRQKAKFRQITNEDEVFALFEAKGFKRYCLEDLSWLEQVALFKQATHVVGAHGSGLSNIVFCDPGTSILEIFQEQGDSSDWYLSQAVQLQFKHYCLQTRDKLGAAPHLSTEVPVSMIRECLNMFLNDI